MTSEPGTTCTIRYRLGPNHAELAAPEPGDFLRTVPRGTCYRIDAVHPAAFYPDDLEQRRQTERRFRLACTRLGLDAVELGARGVYPLVWDSRARRA